MENETAVQPVARVEERVSRLRSLHEHLVDRYLDLAVALHEEHVNALWTQAPALGGGHYVDEEQFWEEAVGVKRRTAYQLIAVGGVLAQVAEQAEASTALSGVGMHKLDVIVPVLKKEPTMPVVRKWSDLAKANSRETLREMVNKALGRKEKDADSPGEKFRRYVLNQMPDLDTRALAEAFFEVGALHAESENAVAIMIAGFQECVGTWGAHGKARVDAA
jgi:hypothetical protein